MRFHFRASIKPIFENLLDTRPKMETHDPNVYPTILGGVSRGFWTPFLDWGARSAISWHLKTGTFGVFTCQKMAPYCTRSDLRPAGANWIYILILAFLLFAENLITRKSYKRGFEQPLRYIDSMRIVLNFLQHL